MDTDTTKTQYNATIDFTANCLFPDVSGEEKVWKVIERSGWSAKDAIDAAYIACINCNNFRDSDTNNWVSNINEKTISFSIKIDTEEVA